MPQFRLFVFLLLSLALWTVSCTQTTTNEPTSEKTTDASTADKAVADTNAADKGGEPATEPVPEKKPDVNAPTEPYTEVVFDKTRINSHGKINGRHALKEFELKGTSFKRVTLQVELHTTCFPFSKWRDDPPPAGHRWPPKCDAYDRLFTFILDPKTDKNPKPGIELVRAVTPFGGPMKFDIDVTDIFNGLPGKHTLRVNIGTWSDGKGQVSGSDGGWNVTAKLKVVPGVAPRNVLAVIPLFDYSYKHNDGKIDEAKFTIPKGTRKIRLEYRTTGHGGGKADRPACIGHADEFCRRTHLLYVDGKEMQALVPWRDDCAKRCNEGPVPGPSGRNINVCRSNPTGSIASVKAPRANWCPGAITQPFWFDYKELTTPGEHTFGFKVRNVAKGGSWRTTAVVIAYGE
jgi:hypothetical protein